MRLLIFAGTKNGRELISRLSKDNVIVASSMSEYGRSLLPDRDNIINVIGKKGVDDIVGIILKESIDLIIDSTHPYAKEISQNIIEASKKTGVKSIRYERVSTIPKDRGIHFDTMEEICNYLRLKNGNILFTTGVNEVLNIVDRLDQKRVFVRVLSVDSSLDIIKRSGLKSHQVVLKKPPFTLEENLKHIEEFNISFLVTKDSGSEGNIDEKIEATKESGIELLVIDRPQIDYKNVYYNINDILQYLESYRLD